MITRKNFRVFVFISLKKKNSLEGLKLFLIFLAVGFFLGIHLLLHLTWLTFKVQQQQAVHFNWNSGTHNLPFSAGLSVLLLYTNGRRATVLYIIKSFFVFPPQSIRIYQLLCFHDGWRIQLGKRLTSFFPFISDLKSSSFILFSPFFHLSLFAPRRRRRRSCFCHLVSFFFEPPPFGFVSLHTAMRKPRLCSPFCVCLWGCRSENKKCCIHNPKRRRKKREM